MGETYRRRQSETEIKRHTQDMHRQKEEQKEYSTTHNA